MYVTRPTKNGKTSRFLEKVSKQMTTSEWKTLVAKQYESFPTHVAVKRAQNQTYLDFIKRNDTNAPDYSAETAVINFDWSENYVCLSQDEIQSANWAQYQISLFTVSAYYHGEQHSYVYTSNDLDHGKDAITVMLNQVLSKLPDEVMTVHFWSDGPSSQFKSRYTPHILAHLADKHKLNIVWHFFATSHGKGPVDGIGIAVKRYVWNKVQARAVVGCYDALKFTQLASDMKVDVSFVSSTEIEDYVNTYDLHEIWSNADAIPGIRKVISSKFFLKIFQSIK